MSSDGLVTLLLNSRPQQIHCNAQGKGSCQTCLERSVAYSTLILTEYDERRFGFGPVYICLEERLFVLWKSVRIKFLGGNIGENGAVIKFCAVALTTGQCSRLCVGGRGGVGEVEHNVSDMKMIVKCIEVT